MLNVITETRVEAFNGYVDVNVTNI